MDRSRKRDPPRGAGDGRCHHAHVVIGSHSQRFIPWSFRRPNGKHHIILAALVTPADVMENVPLRDPLWRVCFRRKLRPGQVTGGQASDLGADACLVPTTQMARFSVRTRPSTS